MKRRRLCGVVAGVAAWGLLLGFDPPRPAFGQRRAAPPGIQVRQVQLGGRALGDEEETLSDGVFLPPDRQAKRRLEVASEMIGENRYGEAVRLLGALLDSAEDFFFKPNPDQPVYRSLKAEAGRLLSGLPPDGRQSYELQFGARARKMLEEAAAAGDMARIAEISRRYFFTQGGAEATYLLGRHYLDQNRPLAAALCFERLMAMGDVCAGLEPALSLSLATCWLRAAQPEKAQQVLARLRREHPTGELVVGGERIKLFASDTQALAWMEQKFGKQPVASPVEAEQWAMFRGDESRNAQSAGSQPLLSLRWRQRACDDQVIEDFVSQLRHEYQSQEVAALSSLHPLAVSDVVLVRTAFALQAVDFATGKLVWKYAAGEESLEQFLRAVGSPDSNRSARQLLAGLDERMWDDATYGTLASDGQSVYYIEDLDLAGLTSNMVMTVLPNGNRRYSVNSQGTNRLAARDLRTEGKLKWAVGGVTGEDVPELAGTFFLGPPLPLMGYLYVLAEVKGQEIRLLVLSPDTGALVWSQQLAVVDMPVAQDPFRRNSGSTPSFADGVLVCPTTAGAIVGLDLSTRSLLWGYKYPRPPGAGERMGGRNPIYDPGQRGATDRWVDASITTADGHVLATPIETDELYCLRLADGQELWKRDRGDNLYVACVHDGKVILVGRRAVTALKLSDASEAWPALALPEGAMPSGRGFYSDHHYYLPLSSAEVVKIDLQSGQIVSRARSRFGNVPGNLICYRDSIISQGTDYLDAYYQLDALKKRVSDALAANPDDAGALAALGEVKMDEGPLSEAVELFRRSYALKADEATRGQLIESLLEGLRVDFPAYRGALAELEKLVDQPRHRLEFLRLKAIGLQAAGDVLPAFDAYLRLVDEQTPWEMQQIDDHLSVRRDRWIRQQLARLRMSADPAAEKHIDAVVAARLEAALAADTTEALRGFLNVFGSQPAAGRARDALVARLGADDLLEKNLLLEQRAQSKTDAVAAEATARMAQALVSAGQTELAGAYYEQLAGRFAQVKSLDGKTGAELLAALPKDSPLEARLRAGPWPEGVVSVREEKGSTRNMREARSRVAELRIDGPRGTLFQNVELAIVSDAQQYLSAKDGLGVERFRIVLNDPGTQRSFSSRNVYGAQAINYAKVYGGLAVLSMGTQLVAVDTLRGGNSTASRILWSHDLNDQLGGMEGVQPVVPRALNVKWGRIRFVSEDSQGRRFGTIGPVSENGVYFQRMHDLHCVDPLTGKTIWVRNNVPPGLHLFGDDEYLFASPSNDGETLVLSAATGELLGTRKLPPLESRMSTVGRQVLCWMTSGQQNVVEMRDAWLDKVVWSYAFAAGSKADVVAEQVVGVLEPGGEFSLVRLSDGKRLAKEQLEKEDRLHAIYLLPSDEGYLLVTHFNGPNNSNLSVHAYPQTVDCPLLSGRVYAFDGQTGRSLWPPVSVVQHGLLLSQPSELPVLVFVRQAIAARPIRSRDPQLSVMCIDKRSGRVLYHKEDLPGTNLSSCEMTANQAAHTVSIALPTRVITLTYTNNPVDLQAKRPVSPEDRRLAAQVILSALGLAATPEAKVNDAASR
jgi:outer membrane protein assembly factor BamB